MLFPPEPGVHCQSLLIDGDCNRPLKWFGLQALDQLLYSRGKETEAQVMEWIAQSRIVLAFWPLIFCFCLGGTSDQDLPQPCETCFGKIALEKLAESWSVAHRDG